MLSGSLKKKIKLNFYLITINTWILFSKELDCIISSEITPCTAVDQWGKRSPDALPV